MALHSRFRAQIRIPSVTAEQPAAMTMVRPSCWKALPLLLLLFLAGSTVGSASDESQTCDASDYDSATGTCRNPEQLESDTKPACPVDIKDEDEEYCLQQASQGKCSEANEESDILKKRCPKACRTCWSCDNVGGEDKCKGK
jgi:hypothetical protein